LLLAQAEQEVPTTAIELVKVVILSAVVWLQVLLQHNLTVVAVIKALAVEMVGPVLPRVALVAGAAAVLVDIQEMVVAAVVSAEVITDLVAAAVVAAVAVVVHLHLVTLEMAEVLVYLDKALMALEDLPYLVAVAVALVDVRVEINLELRGFMAVALEANTLLVEPLIYQALTALFVLFIPDLFANSHQLV
jgi:hypothetical protein